MPLPQFAPFTIPSELPSPGQAIETRSMEFKSKHNSTRFEAAKDVAAFANASGGVILVGACRSGDTLSGYAPVDTTEAQKIKTDYEEAVRDRCSPAPIFDIAFLAKDSGVIVAINVWAMPGQPVGVELAKKDCSNYEREIEGIYFYPLRVGSHTRAILPEQLPMFIDAKARKNAIILSRAVGRALVLTVPKHKRAQIYREDTFTLLDVNLQENALTVGIEDDKFRVSIPIDMIEAAWLDGARACVVVNGYIDQLDSYSRDGEPELSGGYFFVPLPKFLFINADER